jgi:hypothetical protein
VIQDKPQAGYRGSGPGRAWELAGRDDQVVDQARLGDRGQAAQHIGPGQPVRIGFVLDLVAQAGQLGAAGHSRQGADAVGDVGGGQVGPADHAGDQVAGCRQREQFGGLPGHGDGLHDDARGHAIRLGHRLEVSEQEIAAQRGERRAGNPILIAHAQVPQVVVSIDDRHGRHSSHTTGSAAAAPSAE